MSSFVFVRSSVTPAIALNSPPESVVGMVTWRIFGGSIGGSVGVPSGPDSFNVSVDGTVIFSEVFNNRTTGTQGYLPPQDVAATCDDVNAASRSYPHPNIAGAVWWLGMRHCAIKPWRVGDLNAACGRHP